MTTSRGTFLGKVGRQTSGDSSRSTRDVGLTLIELAVVITVLGVLSGIAAFSLNGVGSKGQATGCSTDAATLQAAEQAYYTGTDPTTQAPRHLYAPTVSTLLAAQLLSQTSVYHDVVTRKVTLQATDPNHFVDPVSGQAVTLPGVTDATLIVNPATTEIRADGTFFYLITKPGVNGRHSPCVADPVSAAQQSGVTGKPNVSLSWLLTLQNSGTVL
jgi:prepilin-type N-terminal cleavage/methylation domain-containing protein